MDPEILWDAPLLAFSVNRAGEIRRATAALLRRLDRTPAEVIGAPWTTLFRAPRPPEPWLTALFEAPFDRGAELTGRPPLLARLRAAPPRGDEALVIVDEQPAHDLGAQWMRAQQLEALGHVTHGIAYDFNNLLVAVLGNAQLVATQPGLPADVAEPLADVVTAAQRGSELCRQLSSFANGAAPTAAPTNLSAVVRDVARLLTVTVGYRATVRYDLADPGPAVHLEIGALRQIVLALVTNAAEAFEPGDRGLVSIVTGALPVDASYLEHTQFPDARPGRFAFVEVSDTGRGMTAEVRARVFEPWFSTREGARGLGLYTVARLVRDHGGTLRVYSEPGRGTTVRVLLPSVDLRPHAPPADAPLEGGRGTVLVADDEAAVRRTAGRLLRHAGWQVLSVSNGADALRTCRARPDVDVVLLDVSMPGPNGVQVFRQLRDERPGLPVLLMSGYPDDPSVQRYRQEGLAGFIAKPFAMDTLLSTVDEVVARRD